MRLACVIALVAFVAAKQPNLVHIIIDDWGSSDVGFKDSQMDTPNIDTLAKDGVNLNNFYMTPVCTPSRAALNTGKMPWRYGMQDFKPDVDNPQGIDNEEFLAQRLQNGGYRTAFAGKWDLGLATSDAIPIYKGYNDTDLQLPGVASQSWGGGLNQANFAITNKGLIDSVGFQGYFKSSYGLLAQNMSLDYLWDIHDNTPACAGGSMDCSFQQNVLKQAKGDTGSYSTTVYGEAAVKYVEKHAELNKQAEKPLYLYVAFTSVHAAVQAPSEYITDKCRNYNDPIRFSKEHQEEANTECAVGYPYPCGFTMDFPGPNCNTGVVKRKVQCGAIHAIDFQIGKIVDSLKAANMWEDTVMLIHGDNGGESADGSSNYPYYGYKGSGYEGGMKVTAIYTGGKVTAEKQAGGNSDTLVTAVDTYTTFANLAGGRVTNPSKEIDGMDLYSAIVGKKVSTKRTSAVMINGSPRLGRLQVALLNKGGKRYKLLHNPSGWALYGFAVIAQSCAKDSNGEIVMFMKCVGDYATDDSSEDQGDPTGVDKKKVASYLRRIAAFQGEDGGNGKSKMASLVRANLAKFKESLKNLHDNDSNFLKDLKRALTTVAATTEKVETDGSGKAMWLAVKASESLVDVFGKVYVTIFDDWFMFDLDASVDEGKCDKPDDCAANLYTKAQNTSNTELNSALVEMQNLLKTADEQSTPSRYSPFSDPWADFNSLGAFVNPFRQPGSYDAILWDGTVPASGTDDQEEDSAKQDIDQVDDFVEQDTDQEEDSAEQTPEQEEESSSEEEPY